MTEPTRAAIRPTSGGRNTWPPGGKGIPIPPPHHHRKRFDFAIDRLLNSGTLYGHVDAFWRFCDGDDTALEEFPS